MSGLTNLLPRNRIKILSREYVLRFTTMVLILATILVMVHATLLIPSYVYLLEEVKTQKAHLRGIASTLESPEENQVRDRLTALSRDAAALLSLSDTPSASASIKNILSVPQGGVRVDSIALTFSESGEGQMRLSGIAPTRDSLRRYHAALLSLPFVKSADLPLSVYAVENNLTFSILLSGILTP